MTFLIATWASVSLIQALPERDDGAKGDLADAKAPLPPPKNGTTLLDYLLNSDHTQGKWCPSGFTYMGPVRGCYKVVSDKLTWSLADFRCHQYHKDAHLVFINNLDEQKALSALLGSHLVPSCIWRDGHDTKHSWWTGGRRTDLATRYGPFVWQTSAPGLNGIHIYKTEFKYTNWLWNQPDFSAETNSPESCVMVHSGWDFHWNDMGCLEATCFVCELDEVRSLKNENEQLNNS